MTDSILSITLHDHLHRSCNYLQVVDLVVRETLAILCAEEDPRDMCNGTVDSTVSKNKDNHTMIEWTVDGIPMMVNDEDRKIFLRHIDAVPINVCSINNEITLHESVCKHRELNIWWRCVSSDKTGVNAGKMGGMYMESPWELEKEVLGGTGISECNCVKRHPGIYIYHIPGDLTMVELLRTKKYVSMISLAIMKYHDNTNYDVMKLSLELLDSGLFDGMEHYNVYSLKDAIQTRVYLSAKEVPSVIIQEFDGSYLVYYSPPQSEPRQESRTKSRRPAGMRSLPELSDDVLANITPELLGWTSGDDMVGVDWVVEN